MRGERGGGRWYIKSGLAMQRTLPMAEPPPAQSHSSMTLCASPIAMSLHCSSSGLEEVGEVVFARTSWTSSTQSSRRGRREMTWGIEESARRWSSGWIDGGKNEGIEQRRQT